MQSPTGPDQSSRIIGMALLLGKTSFRDLEGARQKLAGEGLPEDPHALLEELSQRGLLPEGILRSLQAQVQDLERMLVEDSDEDPITTKWMRHHPSHEIHTGDFPFIESYGESRTPGPRPDPGSASAPGAQEVRRLLSVLTLPRWNQYINLQFIGEGGMGRIFRAFDPTLGRTVALKFLRWVDPERVNDLVREARHQAQIDHPGICKVYEVKEWHGQVYVAMQFIEGSTLGRLSPTLTVEQKVELVERVAEAMHAAHRHGLVHRDLKPANIMIKTTADGGLVPYVLDFGLAKDMGQAHDTQDGSIQGTIHYMAPEQARGLTAQIERRTDVYALGVILYELLTGAPPFATREGVECLRAIVDEEIPPPRRLASNVHPDLETIVMKCLEKEIPQRYESARALAEDLRRYREGEPILARPPSLAYRFGKTARKHRTLVLLAGAAIAAVLVAAGLGIHARVTASSRATWAQHFGQEAERIEALLRYARLQPTHDIRPELENVQARIRGLEQAIREAGAQALGPGQYALGRAYLALGEAEEARKHLDQAWSSGFRSREVAYARGRALGRLYLEALQQGAMILDPALREAHFRELQETLRDPAAALLRQGQGNSLEPARFQEGLLALYERRHAEALTLARSSSGIAPWFYEARQLEAQVHLQQAQSEADARRALECLEEAGRVLASAARIAPSDPELCDLESRRWWEELRMLRRSGRDLGPARARLDEVLKRWRGILPGAPGPEARQAWALIEQFRVTPPAARETRAALLGESSRSAESLLASHPDHPEGLGALGTALQLQAYEALDRGLDPRPSFDQAIRLFRKAMRGSSSHFELFEPYAVCFWGRIEYEKSRGADPGPSVEEALAAISELARQHPGVADFEGFLGGIQVEWADYQVHHGIDPKPLVARALVRLETACRTAPTRFDFQFTLGNAHLVLAQHRMLHDEEPGSALDAAESAYRTARQLNPAAMGALYGLVEAALLRAQARERQNQSPLPELAKAEEPLRRIRQFSEGGWRDSLFEVEIALCRARWTSDPKEAKAWLDKGARFAEQALAGSSRLPPALLAAAQVQMTWARIEPGRASEARSRAWALLAEGLSRDRAYVPFLRMQRDLEGQGVIPTDRSGRTGA